MADRYLRQTTSGHIYVWAAHYAARDDMEEVVSDGNGGYVPASVVEAEELPSAALPVERKKRGGRPKKVEQVQEDVPPLFDGD